MRLTVIGSGTISLSPTRGCAAYLVEAGELRILFDCGPGAAHTMARHGIDWWGITHVVLTHWHLDHIGDLPTLIFAWRHARLEPRTSPLTIIGPSGTGELLTRWAAALGDWLRVPGFPLEVIEPALETPLELPGGAVLSSRSVPHTAESVAYFPLSTTGRGWCIPGTRAMIRHWALGRLAATCCWPSVPCPTRCRSRSI